MADADTICAISSPPGEGGIGIIRITGDQAHRIARAIFQTRKHGVLLEDHKLYLGHIVNPEDGHEIDEVLLTLMSPPHTYTREKIAEIYAHGGYAAQKSVLSLIFKQGARLADPGEFTKRAFLNGRIDLVQAESVLDIIHSETEEELHYAVQDLQGGLSRKLEGFRDALREALGTVEALIDFPEEEIEADQSHLAVILRKTGRALDRLIDSYYEGRGIRQGFEVLITGKTNVGKSSLLNCLLMKERAIVTPLPGTTRDLIEDTIYLKGVKVRIVDSAGIRESESLVEQAGIQRVRERIAQSDLIIWLLDGSRPYSAEDEEVWKTIDNRPHFIVINKADLPCQIDKDAVPGKRTERLDISTTTDIGIETLKDRIYAQLMGSGKKHHGALLVTNVRHKDGLSKGNDAIKRAIDLLEGNEHLELIAFELREALHYLGEITGETCTEDILDNIFHRFCIGK